MKQTKILNKEIIKDSKECYFIKPFDVVSTYSSFVETWKVANKVCKKIDDVNDVSLMHSLSENSKFGFISFSKWKSKESFKETLQNNVVLKYHNELNGNGTKSAAVNLYKPVANNFSSNKITPLSVLLVSIFEISSDNDAEAINFWYERLSVFKTRVNSVSLFKSIYKNSKYRLICFANINDTNDSSLKTVFFEANNGFNVYSSFFEVIKKF